MAKRRALKWLLLVGVFLFQTTFWQVAIVQMAHMHTEMNYRTAVDLLDNQPLTFYVVLAVPLLASNAILLFWQAYGRALGQPRE